MPQIRMKRLFLLSTALSFLAVSVLAQDQERQIRDSIPPSYSYAQEKRAGETILKIESLKAQVSPTGRVNPIIAVQAMKGVAIGVDGSSSYFVRGGTLGGNSILLNGVPIYGSTHLFGIESVIPEGLISDVRFYPGGFPSEEGNLTSSLLSITTRGGSYIKHEAELSASNFLASAYMSYPVVKEKASVVVSGRWSPIGLEYQMLKNLSRGVKELSSVVYDLYAETDVSINANSKLRVWGLATRDAYDINWKNISRAEFSWSNKIAAFDWSLSLKAGRDLILRGFYSGLITQQGQQTMSEIAESYYSIANKIGEKGMILEVKRPLLRSGQLIYGLSLRSSEFNPGSLQYYSGSIFARKIQEEYSANSSEEMVLSAFLQSDFTLWNRGLFTGKYRVNHYHAHFYHEVGFSLRQPLFQNIGIEATYDKTVQFYHTLEGLPLGWSLDMRVPSNQEITPERADQYYAGVFFGNAVFSGSVGGYIKNMKGLIYFKQAKEIFSPGLVNWKENVDQGTGYSKGIEVEVVYSNRAVSLKGTYTLSKTDRVFSDINGGVPFPARYDRRHAGSLSGEYVALQKDRMHLVVCTMITLQSGSRETVPAGRYYGVTLSGDSVEMDIPSIKINNYRMPALFRWDAGIRIDTEINGRENHFNLGIYNLTNRHNPFILTYDQEESAWKAVSLLPIMPSLNYTLEF